MLACCGRWRQVDSVMSSSRSKTTRVYHFIDESYGLDDIRNRRLKISLIDSLNDPFELWAIAQPDPSLRQALQSTKAQLARERGVLCFSLSWRNPLMWSHYGDRHRGIVLGFDVPKSILGIVRYERKRLVPEEIDCKVAESLLLTKYFDWHYEQEARVFVALEEKDRSGHYFAEFGDRLLLREVFVGPLSKVTKAQLGEALGKYKWVKLNKTRLAFNTFDIVIDKRGLK